MANAKKKTPKKTAAKTAPNRSAKTGVKVPSQPRLSPLDAAAKKVRSAEAHRNRCESDIELTKQNLAVANANYHAADLAVMQAKEKFQKVRASKSV